MLKTRLKLVIFFIICFVFILGGFFIVQNNLKAFDPCPGEACQSYEFFIDWPNNTAYQLCANEKDDDGDIFLDCEDSDCGQKFGNCGPCPEVENITWDSCGDGIDNDLDGQIDCEDTDCADGVVGDKIKGLVCPLSELTEDTSAKCTDAQDNDSDGYFDCIDDDCKDGETCAFTDWTVAEYCQVLNEMVTISDDEGSTLFAEHIKELNEGSQHKIHIIGDGEYKDVQILIGDLNNEDLYYPYLASTCTISDVSGTGSEQMVGVAVGEDGYAVSSVLGEGETINTFNILITCDTQALDAGVVSESYNYTFQVDVAKTDGESDFINALTLPTVLWESVNPILHKLEYSGEILDGDIINIPYGKFLTFRGVPSDEGSGICDCLFDFNGTASWEAEEYKPYEPDNLCMGQILDIFTEDIPNYVLTVQAEDRANNKSDEISRNIDINVIPSLLENLKVDKPQNEIESHLHDSSPIPTEFISPFYTADEHLILKNASFQTADNEGFASVADVWINGADVGDMSCAGDNPVVCSQSESQIINLNGLSEGRHKVYVSLQDSDGDWIDSNKQFFYICDPDITYSEDHDCTKADWDQDGAPDGVSTKTGLYGGRCSESPDDAVIPCTNDSDCTGVCEGLVCDNCPKIYNPDQADYNANGIGDVCDISGYCSLTGGVCEDNEDCQVNSCDSGECFLSLGECTTNVDCPLNWCVPPPSGEGFCTNTCGFDSDCRPPDSEVCINTDIDYCSIPQAVKRSCITDANCSLGEICIDNCPDIENPDQIDTDRDGLGNVCDDDDDNDGILDINDNCPLIYNPDQTDSDGDGIGDVCEDDTDGDCVLDDGDGSGWPGDNMCEGGECSEGECTANGYCAGADCDDNCLLIYNPDQADSNGDGVGDACECDFDGDGICDDPADDPAIVCNGCTEGPDNCPLVPNPDQADSDGDGIGDACEDDYDGDGIINDLDNCPYTPNANQNDWDGNGTGDACEIIPPEGFYEPTPEDGAYINHIILDTFNIIMPNLTAPAGTDLSCNINTVNHSFTITRMLSEPTVSKNIGLPEDEIDNGIQLDSSYSSDSLLIDGDIDSLISDISDSRISPWMIDNCRVNFPENSLIFSINSDKALYTHTSIWTAFQMPAPNIADAARALKCYLGDTGQFYNNPIPICAYGGDVGFSVLMAKGDKVEAICNDKIDNDGDGSIDCEDNDCHSISYFCRCRDENDCPVGYFCSENTGRCIAP